MKRELQILLLEREEGKSWDIIVIGGGATGLGIALDAVTRGYRTLLLERSDFAGGTSSRSTKLVHGGVRYLAQGDILLVIEALKERGRMLRNAPHLTGNQEFVIPVYTWFDVMLYAVGLKFYDILAGRLSLGKSYFINRERTLLRLPNIKADGLKGGVVYHDGQFDDARMALDLAKACVERGGTILNYFGVSGLLKDDNGHVRGVKARDNTKGREYELYSKVVINATGVFADEILHMDDPSVLHIIKPSQGIHLVVDKSFLRGDSAIMIPKTDDGRVLFAIPWYGRVVMGTTDTPVENIDQEPVALKKEIDFILQTAGRYMVAAPGEKDILSVFAGLRPLAADPDNPHSTKEISRRHKIIVSKSRLVSITGGKWTTYRRMAEETIDRAIRDGMLKKRKCVTGRFQLEAVPEGDASGRLKIYGKNAYEILEMKNGNPVLGSQINDSLPYTKAEIIWICRNEMPVMLEDLLSRRTRALILDAKTSLEIAPVVAKIMAGELGFDDDWIKDQVEKYSILVKKYLS